MCKGTANSNESYTRAVYRLIELFIQLKLFTMNNEVESKVKELIADKLNVELSEVTREANFTTDLGAESLTKKPKALRTLATLSTISRSTCHSPLRRVTQSLSYTVKTSSEGKSLRS